MNTLVVRCARGLFALAALAALQSPSRAQIFISNYSFGSGMISEYSMSGALLNPTFIPDGDHDVAFSGGYLYTLDYQGTIGKYTLSGAPVDATLVAGDDGSQAFAISGSDIFVYNLLHGRVEEYTTAGALVTKTLITGLPSAFVAGIAVSGGDLFLADGASNISEYTTSGTLVNPDVATPLAGGLFVTLDGSDLYTDDIGGISEYTTSGTLVRKDFIPGPVPDVLAIDGSDILLAGYDGGNVVEYTSSGTLVTSTFATGLGLITTAIAIVPAATVAEAPWNSLPYLGAAVAALLLLRRRPVAA
jgi:hypothetical protein